jgi:hypothetical protein
MLPVLAIGKRAELSAVGAPIVKKRSLSAETDLGLVPAQDRTAMHAQSWIGVKHQDWLAIRCTCGNMARYGRHMSACNDIDEPADQRSDRVMDHEKRAGGYLTPALVTTSKRNRQGKPVRDDPRWTWAGGGEPRIASARSDVDKDEPLSNGVGRSFLRSIPSDLGKSMLVRNCLAWTEVADFTNRSVQRCARVFQT